MERIACSSADVIVCVSKSLMTEAINLDLAPERKFIVINNGTANGVNTTLFRNPADDPSTLKSTLGIPAETKVIGFAGRITRDKGIEDLYRAFRLLTGDYILLIIGSIESNDPIDPVILQEIRSRQDIIMPGFVDNIADYYHIMDVLVLPSYREGFGMVALEAAAAGVPAIVSDSTGVRDAVIHQHTGLVFKTGDFVQLSRSMEEILSNAAKRKRLGEQAQRRVETEFIPQEIWIQLNRIYHK
ncbi:glycosyltransferase [Deinococcus sp. JMULE3]|nr:glycosyltransferase [Deinococcus sp. JMULE3]